LVWAFIIAVEKRNSEKLLSFPNDALSLVIVRAAWGNARSLNGLLAMLILPLRRLPENREETGVGRKRAENL
jgi:hypothetical protein